VVAQNEKELEGLDELLSRARRNGVELNEVTAKEACEIEPRVKTFERALYSPTTSCIDPLEVVDSLLKEIRESGVDVRLGEQYVERKQNIIKTSRNSIQAGYVINAAGLYADKIARQFGFSGNYWILPFKGLYLYSNEKVGAFKTNIYPVPNLLNPFLGVHFTVTVGGQAKIGPTAIPAFWREQYSGFDGFDFRELVEILFCQAGLFFDSDFDFKRLAYEEILKQFRSNLVRLASRLAKGVRRSQFTHWGKPGIRAQLLNKKSGALVMDFVVEGDHKSFHILNAVSPAFTCALPFAEICL